MELETDSKESDFQLGIGPGLELERTATGKTKAALERNWTGLEQEWPRENAATAAPSTGASGGQTEPERRFDFAQQRRRRDVGAGSDDEG